jgi:putative addiction module antidote
MTKVITLRKAGGSISAILPKAMAERMNVGAGDKVFLVETDRGVLLTPYDPEFEDAVDAFEQVRKQYRNTLRKLAE